MQVYKKMRIIVSELYLLRQIRDNYKASNADYNL